MSDIRNLTFENISESECPHKDHQYGKFTQISFRIWAEIMDIFEVYNTHELTKHASFTEKMHSAVVHALMIHLSDTDAHLEWSLTTNPIYGP